MKIGTISLLILSAFCVSVIITMMVNYFVETRCFDECSNPYPDCDHNDNNCVGGNHYCYDMCVGGITQPLKYELMEMSKPVGNIFLPLVVIIICFQFYDVYARRGK